MKAALKSKGIWGAIITVVCALVPVLRDLGVMPPEAVESTMQACAGLGALLGGVGRWTAKGPIGR